MSGVDSAVGPTVEQARAVLEAGHLWWGWYCGYQGVPGAPAAFHKWRQDEVDVLAAAGFELSLPIFFPHMTTAGRIVPGASPELDADLAVYAVGVYGWHGVVALDTEASMRGDPWTAVYTHRWCAQVLARGWEPVVYAGGFTFGSPPPPPCYPWWIIPGGSQAPPGTAWQTGQTTIAGLHVDTDSIGSGFPLATRA